MLCFFPFVRLVIFSLALLGMSVTSVYGVTLHVDGSGYLFGASGVDVGGKLYDVEFVDGTCIDLFNGCDSISDFTFGGDLAGAAAASQALLDQVFIDVGGVLFDSIPAATRGCDPAGPDADGAFGCIVYTPVGLELSSPFWETDRFTNPYGIINSSLEASDLLFLGNNFPAFIDTSRILSNHGEVYARWSPNPIPVPAAAWLFGTALIGLIGFGKRRKSA